MTTAFQSSLKYQVPPLPKISKDERYNLVELKVQLAEALGDDGAAYWEALRNFVQGKLNRQEFDFYANLYLPDSKAALHNRFILATIHNAQTAVEPPLGEKSEGFARRAPADKGEAEPTAAGEDSVDAQGERRNIKALLEDPQWRRVKDMIKSLSKPERRAIRQLLKQPSTTPEAVEGEIRRWLKPVVLPLPVTELPVTYAMDVAKGITGPLCFDTKSTPDAETLRYRMIGLALENGLSGGTTEECVRLMIWALESHLKTVISNTLFKVRSNRSLGIPVSSDVPDLIVRTSSNDMNVKAGDSLMERRGDEDADFATTGTSNGEGKVPETPPDTATQERILAGTDENGPSSLSDDAMRPGRPTVGGLRLRERLYRSKSTIRLVDFDFSINICPYVTIESPLCLERIVHWLALQEAAERPEDTEFEGDADAELPQQRRGEGGNDGAADDGSGSKKRAGDDSNEARERKRLRRLRERYSRWFGPYVATSVPSNFTESGDNSSRQQQQQQQQQ
ncbi:hypothetical protein EV182_000216 [Spiromyces aspiralis]|uniref:Uncharacterized protein n=1 Tax=Spiromyces aspiralis TaxID=68401 RepID=A0ACC1HJL2_9FUNG|nr:hypothetical protein EV182_000216 [Spiromyces aspiralis]